MRANKTTIRWGILGCGNVTELKSGPAYQKTERFEIVAVMRRDAIKAADYAKRHGISKFYSNADDLINDPEIDAIYIATPPDTHKQFGLQVANAGKICCIEKPLSPTYHDSLTIYEAFKERNLPLFVAYYRRTLPRFLQVKEWLDLNKIGDIRHLRWHLSRPASVLDLSKEYNWRTDATVATAGYFDDLASHGLDLFTFLLDNIKEVSGTSLNQQGLYTAHDAVTATWVHESGITGSGSWNFGTYSTEDRVEIYGSKGKITFSIFEEATIVLDNEEGIINITIDHPENVQLHHVQGMKQSLMNDIKHPSDGKTATHTSWIMEQITGTKA